MWEGTKFSLYLHNLRLFDQGYWNARNSASLRNTISVGLYHIICSAVNLLKQTASFRYSLARLFTNYVTTLTNLTKLIYVYYRNIAVCVCVYNDIYVEIFRKFF